MRCAVAAVQIDKRPEPDIEMVAAFAGTSVRNDTGAQIPRANVKAKYCFSFSRVAAPVQPRSCRIG